MTGCLGPWGLCVGLTSRGLCSGSLCPEGLCPRDYVLGFFSKGLRSGGLCPGVLGIRSWCYNRGLIIYDRILP